MGTDGRPSNRTVVHRDFYGDNALTWVTDQRYCHTETIACLTIGYRQSVPVMRPGKSMPPRSTLVQDRQGA